MNRRRSSSLLICLLLFLSTAAPAAEAPSAETAFLSALVARPLGPANMSGRVTALAVVPERPATLYAGAACGGVWKTVNHGTTWTPVFDGQPVASIGDVAVAAANPDVVWVGTGEANPRNSVSWGDGVYKSTDGGKTWANMGLRDSRHISRVVIHPADLNTVYVAALGHLWGPNRERGVFKTVDGGRSWQPSLVLDDETGCADLLMDPGDPQTLYASFYRVRRDAYSGGNPAVQTGAAAGLYRTTDGGKTWYRLVRGLPDRPLGRIGLDASRKDPRILYAVVQTDKTLLRRETEWGQPARTSESAETGGVFRSVDRGLSWTKVNDLCPRPFYFSQVRVDPNDSQSLYVLGVNLHVSRDGGHTFRADAAVETHADLHALWIDPRDSGHLIAGTDGGAFFSYDHGETWSHWKNLPLAQFYAIAADLRKPYRVYGGLQDNGTWSGPSATHSAEGVTLADWFKVMGADGFQCQVSRDEPDLVYAEGQYGMLHRINLATGASTDIKPRAPKGQAEYRFNWNAPLLLSPHNPRTLYFGGNHVFRSVDRGAHWQVISKDLTGRSEPGPSSDLGHTLTTLAESPLKAGVLYVGSDDGRLCLTRDGGNTWTDLSANLPGLPAERMISRVECSHAAEGTAYVSVDRHRNDDRRPYVYKTADFGATWQLLADGLPADGPVHVVREDPRNPELLFAGTEFGLFTSLDAGSHWLPLKGKLPVVAVHDLLVHPRDRDLVIATHGRGVYVLDVAPLEEWTGRARDGAAYLFDIRPASAFQPHGSRGLANPGLFAAANPAYGAAIFYYLKDKPAGPVRLTIQDVLGNPVASLQGAQEPGLHQRVWDLRSGADAEKKTPERSVTPGDYVVTLEVGQQMLRRKVHVELEE